MHSHIAYSESNGINIVDLLEDIFLRRSSTPYGDEPISMSHHMLQTAHLAQRANADDTTIVAALLHDIGHYAKEFPRYKYLDTCNDHHELIGVRVVEQWFPELVTDCIRYHVQAKRFLCSTEMNYYNSLSQACKDSLPSQRGPMNAAEVLKFKKISTLPTVLQVRRWDDQAIDSTIEAPAFSNFRTALESVVTARTALCSVRIC